MLNNIKRKFTRKRVEQTLCWIGLATITGCVLSLQFGKLGKKLDSFNLDISEKLMRDENYLEYLKVYGEEA